MSSRDSAKRKKKLRARRRFKALQEAEAKPIVRRQKSIMTDADLPEGEVGQYILTPAWSEGTHTHVRDVEKLLEARGERLGIELDVSISICQKGLKFMWMPTSMMEALMNEDFSQIEANTKLNSIVSQE